MKHISQWVGWVRKSCAVGDHLARPQGREWTSGGHFGEKIFATSLILPRDGQEESTEEPDHPHGEPRNKRQPLASAYSPTEEQRKRNGMEPVDLLCSRNPHDETVVVRRAQ